MFGTGFDLLVEKYKTRRASGVSEENKPYRACPICDGARTLDNCLFRSFAFVDLKIRSVLLGAKRVVITTIINY
ncbi:MULTISPECIES: hypothetical protein [Clostridium]|uniref:Uncharacterized protein n=1 Tax=Clostridium senegalense TaxID=1465809 RepID=A0A6M0H661_9CLOT|nr:MULTISPECIES: hypothetical protein [Clostridium]NEU06205.1 hypothetical protein [Clostridium senegalense]